MTQYILGRGLLPKSEVKRITAETPRNLVRYQEAYRQRRSCAAFQRV
jgi:hypothetical protein